MHFITKKHISRRHFLRGAGGTAIALPLLDAMLPASTAQAQTPALAQRTRYGAIYIPHGKTMAKWTPAAEGKNFEFSEILKPLESHRDQLNVISGLRLQTRLNGAVVQEASTASMIFDVATLVALLSEAVCLQPGDVIVTGTPSGVGLARKPPLFMKAGDVCEVEIEGLGILRNPIEDEK